VKELIFQQHPDMLNSLNCGVYLKVCPNRVPVSATLSLASWLQRMIYSKLFVFWCKTVTCEIEMLSL